jgi:Patatin-like phospholipase
MPFRVLSLDGGGAWSLIQVRALTELYGQAANGHQVLANFDLVAANSGGSLVLAGLVEDLPLAGILQYFLDEQRRRSIFSPTTMVGDDLLDSVLGVAQFQYLSNLDLDAIGQNEVAYIDDYCSFWLADNAPNQPIRPNGATFDPQNPEIGYAKFSQAKAAWVNLFPPIAGAALV